MVIVGASLRGRPLVTLAGAPTEGRPYNLCQRFEGKPLWKLLVEMTPEQLVSCVPFSYITDAL
ncbi:MAG: hypothetical protein ABR568_21750, partial [Pyrinomonadaceae bacterium]